MSGLFGGLFSPPERKVVDAGPLTWTGLLNETSKTGITVSPIRAMRVAAAFACARALAEGVAQVPLKLYRELPGGGKEPAKEHPLYKVLHRRPNDWMTSFQFRETAMYHMLFARDFICVKNMDSRGRVVELLPVAPGSVLITQNADWSLTYEVRLANSRTLVLPREAVFHVCGPSWNTYGGMDFVQIGREALGLAIATEESQALLHRNGGRPGGILTYPNPLTDVQKKAISDAWQAAFGGSQFGTAVMDLGAKYETMAMTGVDAQHIETRRFQIEEVCRILRVHPQLVFHSNQSTTYAASEQNALDHVKHSLGPWYARWEQAIDRDLLTEQDQANGYTAEFIAEGLLRGDVKTRFEAYGSAIEKGWMTRNEARVKESMNPLAGLDLPLMPLNMADGSKPPAPKEPPPAPAPAGQPPAQGGRRD